MVPGNWDSGGSFVTGFASTENCTVAGMPQGMTTIRWEFAMMPSIARVAVLVMAAFTTSMLLGSTMLWATGQASAATLSNQVKTIVLWILLASTYFAWAIVLDYVDQGSLARAVRGGSMTTAITAALVVAMFAISYASSAAGLFGR